MSIGTIQSLAMQSGKSYKEVEKIWNVASKIIQKRRDKDDPGFHSLLITTVKQKLGIK